MNDDQRLTNPPADERSDSSETGVLAQIDQLVAGDLPEDERLTLLAWLDRDPVRWRRCGLAFLEAQAWSEAFGTANDSRQPTPRVPEALRIESSAGHPGRLESRVAHWGWRMVQVASLLICFALGWGLKGGTVGESEREAERMASRQVPIESTTADEPVSASNKHAESTLETKVAADTPDSESSVTPMKENSSPSPSSIPAYVRSQYERKGYRMSETKGLVSVNLPDGHKMVIPVNQVTVTRVGPASL